MRAAAFHAGVVLYLAERKALKRVVHVSSVSGGSLFTGLVYQYGGCHWPTSDAYVKEVFPRIKRTLTSLSLQGAAIRRLVLNPLNWRFALSRAHVVTQAIHREWCVDARLGDLGDIPVWSINCTTGETGRRYRFKGGTMGDYELGYADVRDFPLAKAMAISAAFPGGIGPLALKVADYDWAKREFWGAENSAQTRPPYDFLRLYDGGLYDNLGIEPIFDMGRQSFKRDETLQSDISYLLVSDAGAPFSREAVPHPLNPLRFKRIADIALDQSRALRVRAFINFLQKNPACGAYVGIGTVAKPAIERFAKRNGGRAAELLRQDWLSADDARRAATYGTSLGMLSEQAFDLLSRHGYETIKWNHELMCQKTMSESSSLYSSKDRVW